MALYEKVQPALTLDENDVDKSLKLYQAVREDGTKVPRCTVDLPGLPSVDLRLVDLLPNATDRSTLAGLVQKITRAALVASGAGEAVDKLLAPVPLFPSHRVTLRPQGSP